ncbi:hypothetical protein [Halorussus caseinilyticus]|uniref:Uncharacterized protein n=1 Tax=Halorussus caseinilyticus TaxID=3034025 RepID=A0ABD5WFL1_9EURY|nr:hypothetical protein [Halorussus sp. DT72]
MSDFSNLEEKHADNREERIQFIKEWAEYVRTHPDDEWGEQVNKLVNSQIRAARRVEDERPDMHRLREESPLLNPEKRDEGDDARDDDA